MNNKTITFDFKSMFIGLLAGFAFFLIMGASTHGDEEREHYKGFASEQGFMILDIQTGAYIINKVGRKTWDVGTFHERFSKENR